MTNEQLEQELRVARGNVRALSVVIGLVADKYPEHLAEKFIRECVSLGQAGELMRKETSALRYLSRLMDGETYEKLVNLCSEDAEPDQIPEPDTGMPETKTEAGTKPDDTKAAGAKSENVKATSANSTGAAASGKASSGKTAQSKTVKASASSAAKTPASKTAKAPAKKTVKAPAKKAAGAADAK